MNKFIQENNLIGNIKKLSGGLSNDIYLIDNKYIWKEIKNNYLFDHTNEIEILKSIDYNRFPVKLYQFSESSICYSFIEGENITLEYFRNNLTNIIQLVKDYHNCQSNVPQFWKSIIPKWIDLLPNLVYQIDIDKVKKIYEELNVMMNIFEKDKLVLCHHDVHSGNIITKNDKLYLIDLEFSFNNYIYVELGNIVCEYYTDYSNEIYNYNNITAEIKVKVLKEYGIEIDFKNIYKLELGILISHFYWLIWGILVSKKQMDNKFNYLKFAKNRYDQLMLYFEHIL